MCENIWIFMNYHFKSIKVQTKLIYKYDHFIHAGWLYKKPSNWKGTVHMAQWQVNWHSVLLKNSSCFLFPAVGL